MFKPIHIILFLLATASGGLRAQGLSLESVLKAVAANNPELKAAQAQARMASGMALAAHAWMAPKVSLERMGLAWPNPDTNNYMASRLSLSQELPFPGRTWLRGRAASFEADKMSAEAAMTSRGLRAEALRLFYEYAATQRLETGLAMAGAAIKEMAALSAKRTGFGQTDRMGQFMDTMLAMEDANTASMRPMAAARRRMAEAALKRLMGEGQATALGEAELDFEELLAQRIPSEAEALKLALARDPALAAAQAGADSAGAAQLAAWGGWLPDVMLSGAVEEDAMGSRSSSAMLGLSLPWVWGWGTAGEVKAANAAADKAKAGLEAARLRSAEGVKAAVAEWKAAAEALRLTLRSVLPLAKKGLDLARSGFKTTALGSAEILMAVQDYRMAEESVAERLADWGRAKAMTEMLTAPEAQGVQP